MDGFRILIIDPDGRTVFSGGIHQDDDYLHVTHTLRESSRVELRATADLAGLTKLKDGGTPDRTDTWCKCDDCWGWFVEEHPGEDLDELGRDRSWWAGLPEHRPAPSAPECDGVCITASEIGIPVGGVAYPHPGCPAHDLHSVCRRDTSEPGDG